MPKLAKKYLNDTLDQVRKMFLLGGSGSLLIFILLVSFISIYIERREVAQLVKNEEKEVEKTMEGFDFKDTLNKIINTILTILKVLAIGIGGAGLFFLMLGGAYLLYAGRK